LDGGLQINTIIYYYMRSINIGILGTVSTKCSDSESSPRLVVDPTRGKKNLTKDMMLFLGIEMAGRIKNATPKFFLWVVLELPYKEIGGEGRGPKAEDFF